MQMGKAIPLPWAFTSLPPETVSVPSVIMAEELSRLPKISIFFA